MLCENCGTKNLKKRKYCVSCGTRLTFDEEFFKAENAVDELPKLPKKVKKIHPFVSGTKKGRFIKGFFRKMGGSDLMDFEEHETQENTPESPAPENTPDTFSGFVKFLQNRTVKRTILLVLAVLVFMVFRIMRSF
ncbi:MAG: hypothetical protein LBT26_00370 [Clostridiales Family XIII bacterium]|jgi:hypothetical protein|nr:hypothetical protein [Clostridiales Family XIII bacterium]